MFEGAAEEVALPASAYAAGEGALYFQAQLVAHEAGFPRGKHGLGGCFAVGGNGAPGGGTAVVAAAAFVGEVEGQAVALGLLDQEVAVVAHTHGVAEGIEGRDEVALGRVFVADVFDEVFAIRGGDRAFIRGGPRWGSTAQRDEQQY